MGTEYSTFGYISLLLLTFFLGKSVSTTCAHYNKICITVFVFYLLDMFYIGTPKHFFVLTTEFLIASQLFKNNGVKYYFFKYYKNVVLFLIVMGVTNFVLELFYDVSSLIIVDNINWGKEYSFKLSFPLSWSEMGWHIADDFSLFAGAHMRQYFFFIEPGMAPPFFISLIYIIWKSSFEKKKALQISILVLGVLLTFSTGGPLMLFMSMAIYYFFSRKKKFSIGTILISIGFVVIAYLAFNYMPGFGRQAKIDLNPNTADSIETHENVIGYVLVGVALLGSMSLIISKYVFQKPVYMTIAGLMCLGYLSNYIGFTTLSTMFFFWDNPYEANDIYVNKQIKLLRK